VGFQVLISSPLSVLTVTVRVGDQLGQSHFQTHPHPAVIPTGCGCVGVY